MRFPWVNVLLFILILSQLITGFFGFINGQDKQAWLLWLHSIGAYAIALLLLWKGAVILDVYGRWRRMTGRRIAFAVMLCLLLLILASGFYWTLYGPIYLAGFSLITVHVFLAVVMIGLIAWHSWHYRWIRRAPKAVDRRSFLRLAGLGTVGLVVWQIAGDTRRLLALPGSQRRFTGSYEIGSFSGKFPEVSWIADRPPPVDISDWRLIVDGSVNRPLSLTYDKIIGLADQEKKAVLDCTGGWYSEQMWQGVSLDQILQLTEVRPGAKSLTLVSVSGFKRRFGLEDARGFLLATAVAGHTLSHGHGFPLRLVAPSFRGVNWVKWIGRIRVNDTGKYWQIPLPLR